MWWAYATPGGEEEGNPPLTVFLFPRSAISPQGLADALLVDPRLILSGKLSQMGISEEGVGDRQHVWHLFQDRAFPARGVGVVEHERNWEVVPVRQRVGDGPVEDYTDPAEVERRKLEQLKADLQERADRLAPLMKKYFEERGPRDRHAD